MAEVKSKPRSLRARIIGIALGLSTAAATFFGAPAARAQDVTPQQTATQSDAGAQASNVAPNAAPEAQTDDTTILGRAFHSVFGPAEQTVPLKMFTEQNKTVKAEAEAINGLSETAKSLSSSLINKSQENIELKKKVADLNKQVIAGQKTIDQQNDEIGELQTKNEGLENLTNIQQSRIGGLTNAVNAFRQVAENGAQSFVTFITNLPLWQKLAVGAGIVAAFAGGLIAGRLSRKRETAQRIQLPPNTTGLPKGDKKATLGPAKEIIPTREEVAADVAKDFVATHKNSIASKNPDDQLRTIFSAEQTGVLKAFMESHGMGYTHRAVKLDNMVGHHFLDANGHAAFTISPKHMEIHKFNDETAQKNATRLAFHMFGADLEVSAELAEQFKKTAAALAAAGELKRPDGTLIKPEEVIINGKHLDGSDPKPVVQVKSTEDLVKAPTDLTPDAKVSLDSNGHGQLRSAPENVFKNVDNNVDRSTLAMSTIDGKDVASVKDAEIKNDTGALDANDEGTAYLIDAKASAQDIREIAQKAYNAGQEGIKIQVFATVPEHLAAYADAYKKVQAAANSTYSFAGVGQLGAGGGGIDVAFKPVATMPISRAELKAQTAAAQQQHAATNVSLIEGLRKHREMLRKQSGPAI